MLALVGTGLVLSMATWFSATAILPALQQAFGLSLGSAAWLTNAVQAGFVLGSLTLSLTGLVDALPLRWLMAAAALLAAISNLAILVAPDAAWLLAARFVTGAALAGVYPPALKLLATWFARGRGFAMGAAVGAVTLGSAAPYLVRGLGAALDWRLVVIVASSAAVLAAILLAVFATEGPEAAARPRPDLRRIGAVIRDPALGLATLGYLGHMWELYAMWGWFLAYAGATRAHEFNPAILTFAVIGIGAFGSFLGGWAGDRFGRTATAASMMLVSGFCAVAIGFVAGGAASLFIVLALVWGIAIIGDSAQFSAMTTELSTPETNGAALALQVGLGYALTILSIRVTAAVASGLGWRWTFVILAPGPLIGAVAMLVLRRRPEAAKIAGGRG